MRVLVTGATGNVGGAVLKKLVGRGTELHAGVRDVQAARSRLKLECDYDTVDFEQEIYPDVVFDAVFLLRPPQLANVKQFERFLKTLRPDTKVVFLSVQGADKKAYLPHAKIESVISELGLPHVFIRPSYFMENLTTTLWPELAKNGRIYLPSGNLKFNWIAVSDVAEVTATALTEPIDKQALELCNTEMLGFQEVIDTVNEICDTNLSYASPSLLEYLAYSLKERQKLPVTLVMLLLHYLPRFGKRSEPVSIDFERITGRQPMRIEAFIEENYELFEQLASR